METNKKTYPTVKNLDGFYFDVLRGGKTVSRCFTDLTMQEQDATLETLDTEALKAMCKSFGNALRCAIYVTSKGPTMTKIKL